MADEFSLTPQALRATANAKQFLNDALEVAAYDQADMIVTCYGVEGTAPTAIVRIIGGMQKETEDGWVVLATGQAMTSTGSQRLSATGLPKYIRWEIISFGGTGTPAVIFGVGGMLRTN